MDIAIEKDVYTIHIKWVTCISISLQENGVIISELQFNSLTLHQFAHVIHKVKDFYEGIYKAPYEDSFRIYISDTPYGQAFFDLVNSLEQDKWVQGTPKDDGYYFVNSRPGVTPVLVKLEQGTFTTFYGNAYDISKDTHYHPVVQPLIMDAGPPLETGHYIVTTRQGDDLLVYYWVNKALKTKVRSFCGRTILEEEITQHHMVRIPKRKV